MTSFRLSDLKQKREQLLSEARTIEAKPGELGAEDVQRFGTIREEIRTLDDRIGRAEFLADAERNAPGRPVNGDGRFDAELRRRGYSLSKAIVAKTEGRALDGFEAEASAEIERRFPGRIAGIAIPTAALAPERRASLVVGTANLGGNLVGTDFRDDLFVGLLRNKARVVEAGATVLTGLVGNVAIPKQTAATAAAWVAEGSGASQGNPTFSQITMAPKQVTANSEYSLKLLKQGLPSVDALLRNDLIRQLGLAIDLAALHGSGASNQPTGIAATAGIGNVAGGANGGAPTWSNIVQLETEIAQDNADAGSLAYITNAKVRGKLKTVSKIGTEAQFVWGETETLNGRRALVTNQASSTLTKGSSSGVCSAIFFANWSDLVIGEWGVMDLIIDPYSGAATGQVKVAAHHFVDIAVRNAESFSAMLDALTS